MKIAGFLRQSLIDFPPNKLSCVVFTRGCNYLCPSCHAKHIVQGKKSIPEEEVLSYIDSHLYLNGKKWLEGVVLCGGEPTLQHDIANFAGKLKERNLDVKLDTHGNNPEVIAELIGNKLVDYIAMDIKGPPSLYNRIVGKQIDLRDDVEKGIGVVQHAKDYEFRTTIVPVYRGDKGDFSFLTPEEIEEMINWVDQFIFTEQRKVKWYIQKFVARSKEEMIDEQFAKENLPEKYHKTPDELIERILEAGKKTKYNIVSR